MSLKVVLLFMLIGPFWAEGVELKVDNQCPFPVWMASLPNNRKEPLVDGLIKLDKGASHVYKVIFKQVFKIHEYSYLDN